MIARRGAKSVEEIILKCKDVDPSVRVEGYMKLHERYLRDVEEPYARGDLAQAGEKYWGAVTASLNVVGEGRDWSYYTRRDYAEVVGGYLRS